MKRPTLQRILCIAAIVAVLLALGFFMLRSDWHFRMAQAMRDYPDPAIEETDLSDMKTEVWTREALLTSERVQVSEVLMLINAEHPLPTDYKPNVTVYNGAGMYPDMIDPYVLMRDTVKASTGIRIYVSSDFRTAEEQEGLFSELGGEVAANVGCSEHEAGIALDLYAPHFDGMWFLLSPAGREINLTCGEYGFIIRYPEAKEEVTGIRYEPWHVRYVGLPHAKIIMDAGLCLEEYILGLEPEVWYRSGSQLILRSAAETLTLPTGWSECRVSPDNTGHYIYTITLPSGEEN